MTPSTRTQFRTSGSCIVSSSICHLQQQLGNSATRNLLIEAAVKREAQLRELGKLDLDCQLLQSDGRPLQAESLYQAISTLEQKIGLS